MSYDQSYNGSFEFADAHCLEAALDGFSTAGSPREQSLLEVDDLAIDGLAVKVRWNGSAPASCSFGTMSAVRCLAEHARSGSVRCKFEGDPDEVSRAEGRRSSADLPPRHHRWDVYFAARKGDADGLRRLLAQGVAVDVTFPSGRSSLHLAAASGVVDAVRVLLEAGSPVDRRQGEAGATPLGVAKGGDVVRVLLAAGADKDVQAHERSPLELACYDAADNAGAIFALLEAGAALPEGEALSAMLESCAREGALDVLHALVARDPAVKVALRHPDVVAAAVRTGKPVLLDLLLEAGAELPETFFEDAAAAGAVDLLRGALAGPDALARCGDSSHYADAMVSAARRGHLEVVELLARAGVPVSPTREAPETTPLHVAAAGDDDTVPVVRFLLDHGAPVSVRNESGDTALARACSVGPKAAVELLLAKGADRAEVTDPADRRRLAKIAGPGSPGKKPAAKKPAAKKPAAKKPAPKKPAKKRR